MNQSAIVLVLHRLFKSLKASRLAPFTHQASR